MTIRDWQDVLAEVVDSTADPQSWRAVAGERRRGLGEDLYLGHPYAGVYHLKTFAKNPFEVNGVGTRVARKIDDDLEELFPAGDTGQFGVQPGYESSEAAEAAANRVEDVVRTHADAPTSPDALFEDIMEAIDSPAYGAIEHDQFGRPDSLDELASTFTETESLLNAELDELIEDQDIGRGFH